MGHLARISQMNVFLVFFLELYTSITLFNKINCIELSEIDYLCV